MLNDFFGESGGSTIKPAQPKPRVASQPSARSSATHKHKVQNHRAHSDADDDSDGSEDPLLLTDRSSLPNSPVLARANKPRRDADASQSRPPRATSSKVTSRFNAEDNEDGAAVEKKKKPKRLANPFNSAMTKTSAAAVKPAKSVPPKPKASAPLRSAPARKAPASTWDDDEDDSRRSPLSNSNSPRKAKEFPMQDLLAAKKRSAEPPRLPESPKPAPFPMDVAKMRRIAQEQDRQEPADFPMKAKGKGKVSEPAPFPLLAEAEAKKAGVVAPSSPQPAPFPLAKAATTARLPDKSTTGTTTAPKKSASTTATASARPPKQKSLTDNMFIPKKHQTSTPRSVNLADVTIDTPSPIRPDLVKKTKQPFPLPPPSSSLPPSSSASSSCEPPLRPFPMAAASRKVASKGSPKRPNEDASDSDRSSKRRKCSEEAEGDSSLDADMSMDLSPSRVPNIDPDLLCPFCDEPLPEKQSATFKDLLKHALKAAWPAPRRANRKGLRAPMTAYISVCERHRFEAKILPEAIRAGWPTEIDFNTLPARIQRPRVRKLLAGILEDPTSSSFFMEAMENIVKVGARVAESAMGQYAVFENIQPGYYGERGSVVLHQALFALYPPDVLSAAQPRFAPLSTQTFIHSVLVPETALALVMEDMAGCSRAEALKTLRASSRYGSLMFPDDDEEDGAGEAMMRERARQRRKEIEREEAEEKQLEQNSKRKTTVAVVEPMEVEDSDGSRVSARVRSKKGKARAEESDAASTTSSRRPRQKARAKAALTDVDADDEHMSSTSVSSKRLPKKNVRTKKDFARNTDSDLPTRTPSRQRTPKSYLEIDSEDDAEDAKTPQPRQRSAAPTDLTSDAEDPVRRKARSRSRTAPKNEHESNSAVAVAKSRRPPADKHRKGKVLAGDVIDMTSSSESSSRPPSRASSRLAASVAPRSLASKQSPVRPSRHVESDDSEDSIAEGVLAALRHTDPSSSQQSATANQARATSLQRLQKMPLRDTAMHNGRPHPPRLRKPDALGVNDSDEDRADSTPRRVHTHWDENNHVRSSLHSVDDKTPRPSTYRTSSFNKRSDSSSTKEAYVPPYRPSSQEGWLLNSSSDSPSQASQRSNDEDYFDICLEQMDNDS